MEHAEPSGAADNLSSTAPNASLLHAAVSLHSPSMHLGSPLPSTPWHAWALALMLALTGLALLANAAVLTAVARAAHLRQRLVFVGHLCAVDLLCAALLMPAGMVHASPLLSGAGTGALLASSPPSPVLACRLYAGLHTALVAASILTVAAISVERYHYIVRPMRYEATMTPRLAAAILALLWLVAALLGLATATTLGWPTGAQAKPRLRPSPSSRCPPWWGGHGGRHRRGLALLFAGVCFCAPAAVILAAYGNVYKVARGAARHQHGPAPSWTRQPKPKPKRRSNSVNSQTTIIATVTGRWHWRSAGAALRRRRSPGGGKAAVTLAVIVGQFLLCWLPYFALHLHLALAPPLSAVDSVVDSAVDSEAAAMAPITWLAYSSFAANPFFYGLLNRQIREELAKLLCCCRRQHAAVRPVRTEMAAPEAVAHDDFLHFLQRSNYGERTPYAYSSSTPKTAVDQSCVRIPGHIPEELA